MGVNELEGINLYELLGLTINATLSDIRSAYRKKALKFHPDKNPDNPDAAKLFHQLTEALKILLDEPARAAYDKLVKAKEIARQKHQELDSKRKKFKEDLDAREKAFSKNVKNKSKEDKLKEEIVRLQKEGAQLVEEEIKLLQEEIKQQLKTGFEVNEDGSQFKIKIEWKADNENGGYNEETLSRIFSKYGDINAIVVSSKTKGKALIEFKERQAAELALKMEVGLMDNPIKLKWVNKDLKSTKKSNIRIVEDSLVTERDYESLVLRKMRQAEERKRLIEQMQNEDKEQ